jgi:hypothetical protein
MTPPTPHKILQNALLPKMLKVTHVDFLSINLMAKKTLQSHVICQVYEILKKCPINSKINLELNN